MDDITVEQLRRVNAVLDDFDFPAVRRVMEALDWRWSDYPESEAMTVPDEPELRRTARRLLETVASHPPDYFASTGGFRAELSGGVLWLGFVAAEAADELEPGGEECDG